MITNRVPELEIGNVDMILVRRLKLKLRLVGKLKNMKMVGFNGTEL